MRREPGQSDLVVYDPLYGEILDGVGEDGGERDVGLAQEAVAQGIDLQ